MQDAFARKALLYDKRAARSTTTSSARCTSRSATPTPTPASTGWRACWRRAKTRSTSRGGSCGSPPKTWAWPIPRPWSLAMAAQQAVHFIGMPEGALALAELVVYLAAAPKSNALYLAYGAAAEEALTTRAEPVPLWIRNAPTRLMKTARLRPRVSLRPRRGGRRGGDGLASRRTTRTAVLPADGARRRKPRRRRGWRRRAASGSARARTSRRQRTDLFLHWRRDAESR